MLNEKVKENLDIILSNFYNLNNKYISNDDYKNFIESIGNEQFEYSIDYILLFFKKNKNIELNSPIKSFVVDLLKKSVFDISNDEKEVVLTHENVNDFILNYYLVKEKILKNKIDDFFSIYFTSTVFEKIFNNFDNNDDILAEKFKPFLLNELGFICNKNTENTLTIISIRNSIFIKDKDVLKYCFNNIVGSVVFNDINQDSNYNTKTIVLNNNNNKNVKFKFTNRTLFPIGHIDNHNQINLIEHVKIDEELVNVIRDSIKIKGSGLQKVFNKKQKVLDEKEFKKEFNFNFLDNLFYSKDLSSYLTNFDYYKDMLNNKDNHLMDYLNQYYLNNCKEENKNYFFIKNILMHDFLLDIYKINNNEKNKELLENFVNFNYIDTNKSGIFNRGFIYPSSSSKNLKTELNNLVNSNFFEDSYDIGYKKIHSLNYMKFMLLEFNVLLVEQKFYFDFSLSDEFKADGLYSFYKNCLSELEKDSESIEKINNFTNKLTDFKPIDKNLYKFTFICNLLNNQETLGSENINKLLKQMAGKDDVYSFISEICYFIKKDYISEKMINDIDMSIILDKTKEIEKTFIKKDNPKNKFKI